MTTPNEKNSSEKVKPKWANTCILSDAEARAILRAFDAIPAMVVVEKLSDAECRAFGKIRNFIDRKEADE